MAYTAFGYTGYTAKGHFGPLDAEICAIKAGLFGTFIVFPGVIFGLKGWRFAIQVVIAQQAASAHPAPGR